MNHTIIPLITVAVPGVFQNSESSTLEFPCLSQQEPPCSWVIQAQQQYQLIDFILFR